MALDLQKNSGLPISLDDNGLLVFNPPLEPVAFQSRTLAEMNQYLAEPAASFPYPSVYDMYRGIHLPQDEQKFKEAGLRYDLTVFHPGLLGREFCKTAGHFHPLKMGSSIRYPEVYEVILGKALFLMQKMDNQFQKVEEVYLIEAEQGQDVIFLPGFGHVTINPTNQVLVTANWVADKFESDYSPFAQHHGAAYYLMAGANGKPEAVANFHYPALPKLIKLKPKEWRNFGLIFNEPMYQTGQKSPEMLHFLNYPELYLELLKLEQCYLQA